MQQKVLAIYLLRSFSVTRRSRSDVGHNTDFLIVSTDFIDVTLMTDKPARLIIRFLFGFVSGSGLANSNTETATLSA